MGSLCMKVMPLVLIVSEGGLLLGLYYYTASTNTMQLNIILQPLICKKNFF